MRAVNLLPRDESRARQPAGRRPADCRPGRGAPHRRPVRLVPDGELGGLRASRRRSTERSGPSSRRSRRPSRRRRPSDARGREGRALTVLGTGARDPDCLGPRPPRDLARPARRRLARDDEHERRPIRRRRAAPGQTAPPTGGFTITGYAYSHDGVARAARATLGAPAARGPQARLEHRSTSRGHATDRQVHDHRRASAGGGDFVNSASRSPPRSRSWSSACWSSARSATSC